MRGTAVAGNPFGYNGYYAGTITEIEEVSTPGSVGTVIKIKLDTSNSIYGESFWLTNTEDAPKTSAINELFEATGKPVIKAGAETNDIMKTIQQLIGTKVAVLMLPALNKKSGKFFHKLSYVNNVRTLLPISEVGKIYEGTVDTSAPKKIEPKVEKPHDNLPF